MNAPYPPPVYKPPKAGDDFTAPGGTAPGGPTPGEPATHDLAPPDLQWLADLLDSRWRVPGTSWRFGVDAIAGLVPGAGDLVAGLAGLYIISAATRAGVPRHVIARMIGNIAVDTVVGSVPVLGGIFDIFFKSNQRNLRLYAKYAPPKADPFKDPP